MGGRTLRVGCKHPRLSHGERLVEVDHDARGVRPELAVAQPHDA